MGRIIYLGLARAWPRAGVASVNASPRLRVEARVRKNGNAVTSPKLVKMIQKGYSASPPPQQ